MKTTLARGALAATRAAMESSDENKGGIVLSRAERAVAVIYVVWALLTVVVTWLKDGASADNVTRALVVGLLVAQLAAHAFRRGPLPTTASRWRYVLGCCGNAALVECCYMISTPLYPSLVITRETALVDAVRVVAIDLALTFPAYVVIFHAAWLVLRRYRFSVVEYALLFALGQALGDGGAVMFAGNPGLMAFAPWIMLNYHASNLTPYLRIHDALAREDAARPRTRSIARFVVPLVVLFATYWVMGSLLAWVGVALGLRQAS